MKNIIFPEGLKLSHNFPDYEYEVYRGTFKSKILEYGSETLLIFPDVFLYSELVGCSTSKLVDQWMEMAQKITAHLGGSEDTKLIYVSLDNIELSRNGREWNITRHSEYTTPVLKGDLIKTALFLSNRHDYIRITKQLQFISVAYQDFDYLEYLKSNDVLKTITTSLEDYKKLGSLTSKLDSCRDTINDLEAKLKESNTALEELQLLVQSYDTKLQQLTASLDRSKADLRNESDDKKRIVADNDTLSKSLDEANSLVEIQESKIKDLTASLDRSKADLRNESDDKKRIVADNDTLSKSLDEANSLVEKQESKIKDLTASLDRSKADLRNESDEKKRIVADNDTLSKSLDEVKSLVEIQESKIKDLTASLDRSKADLKNESDDKKRIVADNESVSKSLKEAKSLLEIKELKLNELKEQLNIKQSELEKSMQDIELLNAQKNDLVASIEVNSLELQASGEELRTLNRDFADLNDTYKTCQLDLEVKSAELEELKNLNLEKNAIRHDYDMAMGSYGSALEKLQATLASLRQVELELANTKAKQEGQSQNISSLKRKNSSLTIELRQVNEQKFKLEKAFDKSKSEFEALLSGQNKLLEQYKTVKGEQAEKISKLEHESATLFEQLTLSQLEFTKIIDSKDVQIDQLKAEKKETISKLIVAARDNTKVNSRLTKLRVAHNIVSYEKFLLENESKYKNSVLGRAKSVFSSVKNIRRKGFLEARKNDARLIATSEYFDIEWYLETYDDVKESGVNPAEHYLLFGATEARMPSPKFDTLWYLERYPDVKESGINPLLHYVKYGQEEGRIASPKLIESMSFEKE